MEKPKHSPIGASSMYRWATCPGSIKLSEGMPNKSSVAAAEGSAAHEFVALALERGFKENKNAAAIMEDQVEFMTVYTKYVLKLKQGNPCHIEHSFDMGEVFPGLYGTADCVIYEKDKRLLHVIDYKHGIHLPVEVKDNLQLQYYALGALVTLNYPCTDVRMTIVQPRCYHPEGPIRSWTVSAMQFIDFEADLIDAAKKTKLKSAKFQAGEHCLFCPAKPKCPEKHSERVGEAKKQFGKYTDPADDFGPVSRV